MPLGFEFRAGLKPPHPDFVKPRLWVDDFLPEWAHGSFEAAGPGMTADWATKVAEWPMGLNGPDPHDPGAPILGTCGIAAMNNWQIADDTYGDGNVKPWPNSTILRLYEILGGYVPGDPTTDQGTILQDNLNFWRHNPIEGDELLAFGALRPGTWLRPERINALRSVGPLYLGLQLPVSAEDQFPGPWTFVPGSPLAGGHAVIQPAEAMGTNEVRMVSWMRLVHASTQFMLGTVVEAWVGINAASVERNQRTQYGMDMQGLNQALAALTGEANPLRLTKIL